MVEHYLHDALRSSHLEKRQFYSVSEIVDLLMTSKTIPPRLTAQTLRIKLKSFSQRHILEEFRLSESDPPRYLGAAWLFPIRDTYPKHLSQVREEMVHASSGLGHELSELPSSNKLHIPEEKAPPYTHFFHLFRKPIMISLSTLCIILTGLGTTSYLRYIRTNPGEVIERASKDSHLTYEDQYLLAEAHYDTGNSEAAGRLAFEILSYKNLSLEVEGDCYFLLAKISNQRGEVETFHRFADLARSSYESLPGRFSGRLRNLDTQIAISLIQAERYEEALFLLKNLYEREHVDSYRAFIALMASDAYFWLEDLPEAFAWYEKSHDAYKAAGDRIGSATALQHGAWLQIVAGNHEKAKKSLDEARSLMVSTGKSILDPYLSLTETFLIRCQGKPLPLDSLPDSKDPTFNRYIDYVASYSADEDPIVVNNPPPTGGTEDRPKKKATKQMALN